MEISLGGDAAAKGNGDGAPAQKVLPKWAIREGMNLTAAQRGEVAEGREGGGVKEEGGGGGGTQQGAGEGEAPAPVSAEEEAERKRMEVSCWAELESTSVTTSAHIRPVVSSDLCAPQIHAHT